MGYTHNVNSALARWLSALLQGGLVSSPLRLHIQFCRPQSFWYNAAYHSRFILCQYRLHLGSRALGQLDKQYIYNQS